MAFPTPSQCRDLVATHEGVASGDTLDLNRHMNAAHFFIAHVTACRGVLASLGVDESYVADRGMGTFAVEQHLRYLGEIREGERFSARPRVLERTDKAVHLASFLVNESRDALACVLEVVSLHVDQHARRTTAIPADIADRLDERIRADRALPWHLEPHLTLRRGR